jgi:hypothetical protein
MGNPSRFYEALSYAENKRAEQERLQQAERSGFNDVGEGAIEVQKAGRTPSALGRVTRTMVDCAAWLVARPSEKDTTAPEWIRKHRNKALARQVLPPHEQ